MVDVRWTEESTAGADAAADAAAEGWGGPDDPLDETGERGDVEWADLRAVQRGDGDAAQRLVLSCCGSCQGCPIATFLSVLPYHLSLHGVQKEHPSLRLCCFADDTYGGGSGTEVFSAFEKAVAAAAAPYEEGGCNLPENYAKQECFSWKGDLAEAPAAMRGSPRHPDGRLRGLKCVGGYAATPTTQPPAFVGLVAGARRALPAGASSADVLAALRAGAAPLAELPQVEDAEGAAWQANELRAKLLAKLEPLDSIDKLTVTEKTKHVSTLQRKLVRGTASNIPNFYMRIMPPHVTRGPTREADDRVRESFETIAQAGASPQAVRDNAWEQAQLPTCLAGGAYGGNARLGGAAYCASLIAVFKELRRACPLLHDADPSAEDA